MLNKLFLGKSKSKIYKQFYQREGIKGKEDIFLNKLRHC